MAGSLRARLKATLLRRNTQPLSVSSGKSSLGKRDSVGGHDGAYSASTHSHRDYDASDERSDNQHRSSRSAGSASLSHSHLQDQATGVRDAPEPVSISNSNSPDTGRGSESTSPNTNRKRTWDLGNGHAHGQGGGSEVERQLSQAREQTRAGAEANAQASQPAPPSSLAPPPSNSNITATTSTPGKDLQGNAPAPTLSSSAPAPIVACPPAVVVASSTTAVALPSIHEQPATPPNAAARPPASDPASSDPRPSTARERTYETGATNSPSSHHFRGASRFASPVATPLAGQKDPPSYSPLARPSGPSRKQSLLPPSQTNLVHALLYGQGDDLDADHTDSERQPRQPTMVTRKIWVKRPLASATLVTINEDDMVDDVRDMILRKYANSLGRQFDSPDLTLRVFSKEQQSSRPLQPDEPISKVLNSYYPNGQTVDDALLIDIPSRRTPKASPNPKFYADDRPHESGTDYFPPYPPAPHTHHPVANAALLNSPHALHFPPSMTILTGNQLPPLPSPGSTRRLAQNRPKIQRMHTTSPASTITNSHVSLPGAAPTGTHNYSRPVRSRTHSGASSDQSNHPPAAPAIPTPPPLERTATPPPRVSSPRPSVKTKKSKKTIDPPKLPSGLLDTAVPPINILIVEDNMINLRLLEAFVKRLKVRWQTAVNGREAVDKWRAGGFHLVLMDIQLPIMSGLDATREIRRIEKVNSIGVFSSSASSPPDEILPDPAEEDKLANTEMFKSPVIIVALTASSLQSDRHEALAAGCNDFLTKPVHFDWLQRKVKEWGCMQALIDFDGWRKWKDFSQKTQANDAAKKAAAAATKVKPVRNKRLSMTAAAA